MAAPKGNKNSNKAAKFPEECKKAYVSYCAWIAQGKSQEAWKYKSDKMTLTHRSMEKYIREFPVDFPSIHKEEAKCDSLAVWEERGLAMMLGQIEKCQPAIFQMFMRNKFGWDKENSGQKETTQPLIQKMAEKWRNR